MPPMSVINVPWNLDGCPSPSWSLCQEQTELHQEHSKQCVSNIYKPIVILDYCNVDARGSINIDYYNQWLLIRIIPLLQTSWGLRPHSHWKAENLSRPAASHDRPLEERMTGFDSSGESYSFNTRRASGDARDQRRSGFRCNICAKIYWFSTEITWARFGSLARPRKPLPCMFLRYHLKSGALTTMVAWLAQSHSALGQPL